MVFLKNSLKSVINYKYMLLPINRKNTMIKLRIIRRNLSPSTYCFIDFKFYKQK